MRLDGHRAHDLFIEGYAARRSAHRRKQSVVKPFAPAQPAAMQIECYPRHEDKVQPV